MKHDADADDLLEERLQVHDRKQFELKVDYEPTGKDKLAQYAVDAWLFIPKGLFIDRDSWPKESFYQDLHNSVRLKTPKLSFVELRTGAHSPLVQIEERLLLGLNGSEQELVYDAKMLSCVLRAALRRFAKGVRACCDESRPSDLAQQIRETLEATPDIGARYRRAVAALVGKYGLSERTRTALRLIDEYVSLVSEQFYRRALVHMKALPHEPHVDELRKQLLEQIVKGEEYRKAHGMSSLLQPGTDNEEYTHRLGFLKRFCMNILFLSVQRTTRHAWEESLFALAAGGAMAFALAVGLFAQSRYPQASFNFFIVAVLGYMVKDRIKDRLRRVLSSIAGLFLYERATRITDPLTEENVGVCKEKVEFGTVALAPPEVIALRTKDDLARVAIDEQWETVIRYRKTVALESEVLPQLGDGIVSGLTDLIRLNVERLTRDMADPEVQVDYFALADLSVEEMRAAKTYFVDIAFRFSVDDADVKDSKLRLVRLVLDRNGIKRLVELTPEVTSALQGEAALGQKLAA